MRPADIVTHLALKCTDCGVETPVPSVGVKSAAVDRAEILPGASLILDKDPGVLWITVPDVVTCAACRAQYRTYYETLADRPDRTVS